MFAIIVIYFVLQLFVYSNSLSDSDESLDNEENTSIACTNETDPIITEDVDW